MKKNMLLIHGWDYELYSKMTNHKDAWEDYKKLILALEEKYNVYKLNLPGFCHQKEPEEKQWNVSKFADYIQEYIKNNNLKIDVVLGYSFGGAVAIKWKCQTKCNAKLFLVAPAIIRNADNSKKFLKTPKFLNGIRNFLRDLYVIYIVKTSEMVHGTPFLRKSYQLIAREDMRNDLNTINPDELCIVYGSKDQAVAPFEVLQSVPDVYKRCIHMVENANHDDVIIDFVSSVIDVLEDFD